MTSKTYCPIPFYHTIVRPDNKCGVCCAFQQYDHFDATGEQTDIHVNELNDLSDYLKSDPIKNIQQQMLTGEKVAGCHICDTRESMGYESVRTKELERINFKEFEFTNNDPKLEYIEITFGNYCNLACRSCGSALSTSWYEDSNWMHENTRHGVYFPIADTKRFNVDRDFNIADFKNLKLIKITGGEPMLHPNFYKFLGNMKQDQIDCEIFTNVSHVPKQKLLDSLLKFKSLKLYLSIDDVGQGQEYLRHNTSWEVTEKSTYTWLRWVKENNDRIKISLAPTFSIYNALSFPRLLDWWLEVTNEVLGELAESNCSCTNNNILTRPQWMSMSLHKQKDKVMQEAYFYIKKLKTSKMYGASAVSETINGFVNYMESAKDLGKQTELRRSFAEITLLLDKKRKQSIKEVYPNLYEDFKTEFDNCDK